jgi:hypothetical protein
MKQKTWSKKAREATTNGTIFEHMPLNKLTAMIFRCSVYCKNPAPSINEAWGTDA